MAWKRHCNSEFSISAIEKLLAIEKVFQTKSLKATNGSCKQCSCLQIIVLGIKHWGKKIKNKSYIQIVTNAFVFLNACTIHVILHERNMKLKFLIYAYSVAWIINLLAFVFENYLNQAKE